MNIISSNNQKNVVSLEELVPQHDCLKLLILHTPYTLVIDTLYLCVNLVKLDLSKNNLDSFPYLGELSCLKFMFIHQNKLDINQLRNIFQKNGKKSKLSETIVWVTFWGNKNSFLGRHYLATQTSAIAIDKNMVVQQQKTSEIVYNQPEAFGYETDISQFLMKKNTINRHASEQQYMRQLWLQMNQLRKRNQKLFPVIKIQKMFRGWIIRQRIYRASNKLKQHNYLKDQFFTAWKEYVSKKIKLRNFLQQNKKEYLLLEPKQIKKKQIQIRLLQIAQQIKKKVISRKIALSSEMKFFNVIRQNYLKLRSLYQTLQLEKSNFIYVLRSSWQMFQKYVIPFVKIVNSGCQILPMRNSNYNIHFLYEYYSDKTKQFIKILQTNMKSSAFCLRQKQINLKQIRRGKKSLCFGSNLKNIYKNPHLSNKKQLKVESHIQNLQARDKFALEELIKIEVPIRILKDITRGIYFFNSNFLTNTQKMKQRIHIFSEAALVKITSAVKIQKIWRGYCFRKKNDQNLRIIIKLQRSVIILQRWVRKISWLQKNIFMDCVAKKLNDVKDNVFYVEMSEYLNEIKTQKDKQNKKYSFIQQNTQLYLDQQNNTIVLSWDNETDNFHVIQNIRYNKPIFTKYFLKNKIGLSDEQIQLKFSPNSAHNICQFSYLFHHDTQSSLVSKNGNKYLQVKCQNKNDAKFRILSIMLMTYSIKNKERLKIYTKQKFSNFDILNRTEIGKKQVTFICNQNFGLIKLCEQTFQNQPKVTLHVISNKFYFQIKQQKPVKTQQKFFIYINNYQQPIPVKVQFKKSQTEGQNNKRYKTQASYTSAAFGNQNFLTEFVNQSESNNASEKCILPDRVQQMIKKRSMKQFKIDKKNRKKLQQPSFILDSISINDRLTTQPDMMPANISNRQNNSIQFNSKHAKNNSQLQMQESGNLGNKRAISYAERRNNSFKKKQNQNFTKRFVNLANFIQNQYASDYRRRIKTEFQTKAIQSADNIKNTVKRSQSQRQQQMQQKHKKIRQLHSNHREIVQKNITFTRQRSLQLKNEIIQQKQKRQSQKSKLKRLKVTFAQQCYPLASKSRKNQHFSS